MLLVTLLHVVKKRAKLIRQHIHDSRWEEPILLALGFVGLEYPAEASELLEISILAKGEEARDIGLVSSSYEELLGRDYLFALRCLGDNIPVHSKLLKQLVERLANELLHNSGLAQFSRYKAMLEEKLAYLEGSDGALLLNVHIMEALQHDSDADVRRVAISTLRQLNLFPAEVVTVLLEALHHDPDASVRRVATYILGQLASSSAEVVTALLEALHHDPDDQVRILITASLGLTRLSAEEIITTLRAVLQSTSGDNFIAEILLSPLFASSTEAVAFLLEALHHDPDAGVRSNAVSFLIRSSISSAEVVAALLEALHHDPDASVRSRVASTLERLSTSPAEVVAALLEALHHDPDASVRSRVASTLEQSSISSAEVVAALLEALHHDPDTDVRGRAALSLAKSGKAVSEKVMLTLNNVLEYAESWSVRRDAAKILGKTSQGDEATVEVLKQGLLDDDDDVRIACVEALIHLARCFSTTEEIIQTQLLEAIREPIYDKLDSVRKISGHDYAYGGLWLLVTGEEIDKQSLFGSPFLALIRDQAHTSRFDTNLFSIM